MQQETLVWRNMRVFDGYTTLPETMAVEVRHGKISLLQIEKDYRPDIGKKITLAEENGLITPGLIDCHTHIIYAGNRAHEFEMRLEGASYEDIAKQGGGIISTVHATRAASETQLLEQSLPRLDALLSDGMTTVEIKSGYGLTLADELKMLRVARQMEKIRPVRIKTTLLAAHAVPPEYKNNADAYVDVICHEIIPAAVSEHLADSVDVFCESIAFSLPQCEKIFQTAQKYQLPIKAHAEQLSNMGGTALAAQYRALSVDHVEYLDEAGIAAMQQAGTVAVLLPGAFYMLHEKQLPPVALLRQYGIPMAIATDANPGSSPIYMPSLILNMACTLFGLTPTEALRGMTSCAARALGLPGRDEGEGLLKIGSPADFCVWNVDAAIELCYAIQPGRLRQRVFHGKVTHG